MKFFKLPAAFAAALAVIVGEQHLGTVSAGPAKCKVLPSVPASLIPPAGNDCFLELYAKGTQNYRCNGTAWIFDQPEAKLYRHGNQSLKKIALGIHYFLPVKDANGGRPTWELTAEKSLVTTKALVTLPSPDASKNIPWLQTEKTGASLDGILSATTYVLRVNTEGGVAPDGVKCTAASTDQYEKVPYDTTYIFFQPQKDDDSEKGDILAEEEG